MFKKEIEEYLFERWKYYLEKYLDSDKKSTHLLLTIEELEDILEKFFEYDFHHSDFQYWVGKKRQNIYQYNL